MSTGIVDTVLCGVVGRDPAKECAVEACREAIVPMRKCARSSNLVRSDSSKYSEYTTVHPYSDIRLITDHSSTIRML